MDEEKVIKKLAADYKAKEGKIDWYFNKFEFISNVFSGRRAVKLLVYDPRLELGDDPRVDPVRVPKQPEEQKEIEAEKMKEQDA